MYLVTNWSKVQSLYEEVHKKSYSLVQLKRQVTSQRKINWCIITSKHGHWNKNNLPHGLNKVFGSKIPTRLLWQILGDRWNLMTIITKIRILVQLCISPMPATLGQSF